MEKTCSHFYKQSENEKLGNNVDRKAKAMSTEVTQNHCSLNNVYVEALEKCADPRGWYREFAEWLGNAGGEKRTKNDL